MAISPLAGKPAPKEILIDPAEIERRYYADLPDPDNPAQRVSFGTSGHRGSPLTRSFNEAHIIAITQAICEYRAAHGIRARFTRQAHRRGVRARHTHRSPVRARAWLGE